LYEGVVTVNPRLRGWSSLGIAVIAAIAFTSVRPALADAGDASPPESAEPAEGEATAKPPTLGEAEDLLREGSYQAALEAYQALSAVPDIEIPAGIGIARCRMREGHYDEAITGLTALSATDSAEWHYTLATLYALKGRYPETIDHCRRAVEINADHAGARLLAGGMLELLGRREEAIADYRWFDRQLVDRIELPTDASWITDTALGFLRYSELTGRDAPRRTQHVLHEMLQPAYTRIDRTYWPARIAAADLLRAKYNNDAEDGSVSDYRAALQINSKLPEAHVGLGEIALDEWNFEEAEERAEKALEVNPNFAPAIHLLAKSLLRQRRYTQAAETCARALAVNPNDLVALSLLGGVHACGYDDKGVEGIKARVAKINPACATMHWFLGEALAGIRQYAASEREYQKAIELAPGNAGPRNDLGMMYMQWGFEDKARDVLDAAWTMDPFNKRTKFTLELLESLQEFASVESEHFVVRYDAERDATLGDQMAAHLERIYPRVTADYGMTLDFKTKIEVYPTQRAFAVRITGNPWIHTIGACTGRVIAVASPRRATDLLGTYDFAHVLTHEFTHTVTLEATHNRIPHWLTEGLAVAQEDSPRPFEWMQLLVDSVRRERLFTLESINRAFIRPSRPADRPTAYAQSEWMCEYLVNRFGYDIVNKMLSGFRKGETQAEVFSNRLGLTIEQFDREFAEWARRAAAEWGFDLTAPEDVEPLREKAASADAGADVFARLARAELDAGNYDRAYGAVQRSLELNGREPGALRVQVRLFEINGASVKSDEAVQAYWAEAVPVLERLLEIDADDWTALRLLADNFLQKGKWERATELYKRLQRACPMDPASWRGLAAIYLETEEADLALPQLLELARSTSQSADVAMKIARIYRDRERLPDSLYWFRRASHIEPLNPTVHDLFADTLLRSGELDTALEEYLIVTQLEPDKAGPFESAASVAHRLGDSARAAELARRAVDLDPNSTARSLLPERAAE